MSSNKLTNLVLEQNLLNIIINDSDYFFSNYSDFDPRSFANTQHIKIFKLILKMHKDKKAIPSVETLKAIVKSESELDLSEIELISNAIDSLPKEKIKKTDSEAIVISLTKSLVSRLAIKHIHEIVSLVENGNVEDAVDGMNKYSSVFKEILSTDKLIDVMAFKKDIDKRIEYAIDIKNNPNKIGMVKTGLVNFDKFNPKQSPGELVIYQARTNVGKSMFLMNTAIKNHQAGLKVIVITIEMNAMQWATRIDSCISGFKHSDFSSGEIVSDNSKLTNWKDSVKKFGGDDSELMVYWRPENCTPAVVERIISRNPFKPDLVVVDYAGDMKSGLKNIGEYDPRSHAEIYSKLKEIAGKFTCVLYTAQQTKRGVKTVNDESGAWSDVASAKADIIFAIQKEKEDEIFETEINGIRYRDRLTISAVKARGFPKNCYTNIIPIWDRMTFIEKEFDTRQIKGGGEPEKLNKTEKTVTKHDNKNLNKNLNNNPKDDFQDFEDDMDIPDLDTLL